MYGMFQEAEMTAEDPGEGPGEGTTGRIPDVQVWITGGSLQGINVVLLMATSSLECCQVAFSHFRSTFTTCVQA